MTPAARIQAAIDLLADDEASRPADERAQAYFRARRYIGSKDRRDISERIWGIARRRAKLNWWLERAENKAEKGEALARALMIAHLSLSQSQPAGAVEEIFSGEHHAPAPLNEEEKALLKSFGGSALTHRHQPDWVQAECPEWLAEPLKTVLGEDFQKEMKALNLPAPVDLRVNTLKGAREDALAALASEGIDAESTPWSPVGLRLRERINLSAMGPYRDGLVEVQDESSQLAALLTDARPGMGVVDFCAGAGGKTLALAAAMKNKGRLIACDTVKGRLDKSRERLKRAGAFNVTPRILTSDNDKWVKRKARSFDRVLVDAPCSGTGTWRRAPDARWRLTADKLTELTETQTRILKSAARMVKPGGRLIYATCSLLPEENGERIDAFLAEAQDFTLLPIAKVWEDVLGTAAPEHEGPTLTLTPARHGTDGFFLAVMERKIS